MKTEILFLLCFIGHISIFAQTTPIPDSSFEQALIDEGIDNNGLNGNIQNSDASQVIILNIDSLGINSLDGIEAFINLQTLSAQGNNLISVNLATNNNLEILNLSYNQLSAIDLNSNPSLVNLNLEGNAFTTINLTNLPLLEDLSIGGNLLTSLDVTHNPLLSVLEIWNIFSHENSNQISNIDLSNNPLLFRFLCTRNQLTDLDLSNNTELYSLSCGENNLTELDLSNNPNLFQLSCDNNQLTELDVAHLSLGILNCYDNQIDFLDLEASTNLVQLWCSNNGLDSLVLPATSFVLGIIVDNNNLKHLDISHMGLVQDIRCENNNLEYLNIKNGLNTFIESFSALNNPMLSCVLVDDVDYANTNFSNAVDQQVQFSEDCQLVSVEEWSEPDNPLVFPNPFTTILYSKIDTQIKEILVYNNLLHLVHAAKGFPLDLNYLPPGNYFIGINTESEKFVSKVVKLD